MMQHDIAGVPGQFIASVREHLKSEGSEAVIHDAEMMDVQTFYFNGYDALSTAVKIAADRSERK